MFKNDKMKTRCFTGRRRKGHFEKLIMKSFMFILLLTDTNIMKYQKVENDYHDSTEYNLKVNPVEVDQIKINLEKNASWKYETVWNNWMEEEMNRMEDYSWTNDQSSHDINAHLHTIVQENDGRKGASVHVQEHDAHLLEGLDVQTVQGEYYLLSTENICQFSKGELQFRCSEDCNFPNQSMIRDEHDVMLEVKVHVKSCAHTQVYAHEVGTYVSQDVKIVHGEYNQISTENMCHTSRWKLFNKWSENCFLPSQNMMRDVYEVHDAHEVCLHGQVHVHAHVQREHDTHEVCLHGQVHVYVQREHRVRSIGYICHDIYSMEHLRHVSCSQEHVWQADIHSQEHGTGNMEQGTWQYECFHPKISLCRKLKRRNIRISQIFSLKIIFRWKKCKKNFEQRGTH